MNKTNALNSNNTVAKTLAIVALVMGVLGLIGSMILASNAYDGFLVFLIGAFSSALTTLLLFAAGEAIALLQIVADKNETIPTGISTSGITTGSPAVSVNTVKDIERNLPRL